MVGTVRHQKRLLGLLGGYFQSTTSIQEVIFGPCGGELDKLLIVAECLILKGNCNVMFFFWVGYSIGQ